MAVTPAQLFPSTPVPAANTTLYTVPASTTMQIKKLTVANQSATAAMTVSVNIVAPSGTAGATNLLVLTRSIPAAATLEITEAEGHILPAGAILSMAASVAGQGNALGSGVLFS